MKARHNYQAAKAASMKSGTKGLSDIPYNNSDPSGPKEVGKVAGAATKARLDRGARGGGSGSDKSPMAPASSLHPYSSARNS